MRSVTILGGGNGARTTAAELGLAGHDVTLMDVQPFAEQLQPIADAGGITATGVIEGFAPVRVVADPAEAIDTAEALLVVVPTKYHLHYAELLAPRLRDGHNVVLMPGSLGSLEFAEVLRHRGRNVDVTVSEMAALPYATRITGPAQVSVFGRRRYLAMGVFPANSSARVMAVMADLYPDIETMPNVLAAGLNNPNPTLHCLGVLLSASRIEYSEGDFYYYREGMTPHVCQAIEAIDAERIAIGAALGVDVLSLKDTYDVMGYGPAGDTLYEVMQGVELLRRIKGPSEINSRYLTEDVPIGLTIYSQLGRAIGVDVPLMESVIHLAGALLGRDFAASGRTLKRCGIDGMTRNQLVKYVTRGKRP